MTLAEKMKLRHAEQMKARAMVRAIARQPIIDPSLDPWPFLDLVLQVCSKPSPAAAQLPSVAPRPTAPLAPVSFAAHIGQELHSEARPFRVGDRPVPAPPPAPLPPGFEFDGLLSLPSPPPPVPLREPQLAPGCRFWVTTPEAPNLLVETGASMLSRCGR